MPTHAMMMNAPSTSGGYRSTIASSWPMTSRIIDDAEDAAGQDHPELRRHRDRHEDRIDGEDDVRQLDFDDRRPERGQAEHRLSPWAASAALPPPPCCKKWCDGEVQQVGRAGQLHPPEPDQVGGQQRRDGPKREGADDAVAERLLLVVFGSPSTSTASTIALSALSSPSSMTSRAIVTKSAAERPGRVSEKARLASIGRAHFTLDQRHGLQGLLRDARRRENGHRARKSSRPTGSSRASIIPTSIPGDKAAEAKFKEINEAYEVLGDPDKRKKYDELGANWRMYEQAGAGARAAAAGRAGTRTSAAARLAAASGR